MEHIGSLHQLLMIIACAISLFVAGLLAFVIYRYRASKNPVASTVSHYPLIEVIWTVVPVIILVIIAIPSMKLLFRMEKAQDATITLKAVGHQWYWSYEYPKHKIEFESRIIQDKDLKPEHVRLLDVDNRVIVPVNETVRVLVTATDVLHSFAVPALGIKRDAVPGRVNETWFKISKEGVYYGQCSELCGSLHGFMPIAIEVVSKDKYDAWVKEKSPPAPAPAPKPAVTPQPQEGPNSSASPASKTIQAVPPSVAPSQKVEAPKGPEQATVVQPQKTTQQQASTKDPVAAKPAKQK